MLANLRILCYNAKYFQHYFILHATLPPPNQKSVFIYLYINKLCTILPFEVFFQQMRRKASSMIEV